MAQLKKDILLTQFKLGATSAFNAVFKQHYKPLCSFAKQYVLDLDIAEDIIQELFVRLWEKRNQIHFKSSIKTYLFQSTKHDCLNYLKQQNVKDKYKSHITHVSTENFFQDTLIEEELNLLIYNTIQELPPRCKKIFELSRFEEKSFEEIAQELSISKNTIKNQLVKALKQIRQVLEKNEILMLVAAVSMFI